MQHCHRDQDNTTECYCLHCHATADDSAAACVSCGAPFVGCGVFDKVRGPRPSSLFFSLFDSTSAERAA